MKVKELMISVIGIILYIAFVLIAEFCVVHINQYASFGAAVIFTLLSLLAISIVVLLQATTNIFRIQWFAPIIAVTFLYLLIVDIMNFLLVRLLSSGMFILMHMAIILLYYVVIAPMILMGIKKED